MLIILFAILVMVFAFIVYTRKWSNPYQLIFIFGKKGAGKSCLMVNEMLKHLRKGWIVYTDMQDILIPDVRIINTLDLATFVPEGHSVFFCDEAGVRFDNRNFASFPVGLRDFFKFQRKYHVKIYMNSQSFDVDLKIRTLVDQMILQTSLLGCISISRPIKRTITLTEPTGDAESRIADKLVFEKIWNWKFYWMPKYFKYFNSFDAPSRDPVPFRYPSLPEEIGERKRFR